MINFIITYFRTTATFRLRGECPEPLRHRRGSKYTYKYRRKLDLNKNNTILCHIVVNTGHVYVKNKLLPEHQGSSSCH